MLTADDIKSYEDKGYILVEDAITPEQLAEMRRVTYDLIDKSRNVSVSNAVYDLDDGHCAETPRLTRIKSPGKQHPIYKEVLRNSKITEVIKDLLGPNTTLKTDKLNTKAPGGGAAVEWHQDWAFYPHTNDDLLAIGLMLEDVDEANGPLQVIPGSHKGPVLAHTNAQGVFCGAVNPGDPDLHLDEAVTLTGKAGSMTVHHVRLLHGSAPNVSDRNRLILFYECAACDAWPLVASANQFQAQGQAALWQDVLDRMISGEPILQPRMEVNPVRIPLPPAPDAGSIFKTQKTGGAISAFDKVG